MGELSGYVIFKIQRGMAGDVSMIPVDTEPAEYDYTIHDNSEWIPFYNTGHPKYQLPKLTIRHVDEIIYDGFIRDMLVGIPEDISDTSYYCMFCNNEVIEQPLSDPFKDMLLPKAQDHFGPNVHKSKLFGCNRCSMVFAISEYQKKIISYPSKQYLKSQNKDFIETMQKGGLL